MVPLGAMPILIHCSLVRRSRAASIAYGQIVYHLSIWRIG